MATAALIAIGVFVAAAGAALVFLRPTHRSARGLFLGAAILFVTAGALTLKIARDRGSFRVTSIDVLTGPMYAGPCPAQHPLLVRITTVGGSGTVVIRALNEQQLTSGTPEESLQKVPVTGEGSLEVRMTVPVTTDGPATAYVFVQTTTYRVASARFRAMCSDAAN